mmetsp:Transcript_56714/g.147407  ORF Transcript_56714/g.147407 Transcript_56714/m.147407 type:complete len:218 (+) Transcript_56714:226-879(+)
MVVPHVASSRLGQGEGEAREPARVPSLARLQGVRLGQLDPDQVRPRGVSLEEEEVGQVVPRHHRAAPAPPEALGRGAVAPLARPRHAADGARVPRGGHAAVRRRPGAHLPAGRVARHRGRLVPGGRPAGALRGGGRCVRLGGALRLEELAVAVCSPELPGAGHEHRPRGATLVLPRRQGRLRARRAVAELPRCPRGAPERGRVRDGRHPGARAAGRR